ncbi:MAG: N-6 DNA methylase [Bacteroidales bacterium]|jgi:type I restriction-modification system DNA methylase subunit/REP element-mobilizing transposase RayT|nr:N-6 DNA methylase [Bacteroidales bacterium]
MSIFQKSVIQKHLANLDKAQVEIAFQKLKKNYDPAKIEQIKELKEEEYQDGFLRDIFVDVLGYTLKPNKSYNLAREYKNQADSKKADGAILKEEKAIAVIELKSVKTKDLKSITDQAFNYKNNQPECKYVITSNFQKLRFYIDYANEYEEFDLFNLEKDDFDLLYLLLSKESIFQNLPLKLKEETKFHEQEISDKLYKDYSQFKRKLFDNLCKNHPESDKLTLFKKSQKLLDRFLFILFAEDSNLLPPNSISRIVERFELLKEEDAYKPLYEIFKQYFGYMNIGRKGKTSDGDIPAYNGGLFYADECLDKFLIDDDVLIADLIHLSEYDFSAEVDVNILGHIFEHSLNEIEEVTAEIEGTAPDKTKSKRKKDGVFYTPKYITQYIVENTIGTLCTEKRKELEIEEIEFDGSYRTKEKNLTVKGKKLYKKLINYKEWLISLKIIDPACGSGAFLNQALNFLIKEHKIIDDIIAELTNTPLRLFDVDKTILENNLYGVDINEESVEIAKLSLWLRTAQKGRILSSLNDNIKCGNSLIDDPEVAGDKAFNWNKEFPQIFKEKERKAWHITTATHNSRYSQRMFDNYVKLGDPVWLSEKEEEIVTETIVEIAEKDKLNIISYNICGDHMHMLLVCEEKEVPNIVGKIKSMSARACNIEMGRTMSERTPGAETKTMAHASLSTENSPETRGKTQAHLWTQKFGCKEIKSDEQLNNTIGYIRNNRQKHNLADNIKLRNLINKLSCSHEDAFRTEYKGGFDVVIGNPPYVFARENITQEEKDYYTKNYSSANYQINTYLLFIEKSIDLLKIKGTYGLIVPNAWLMVYSGIGLREYILKTCKLNQIINLEGYSFDGVSVETIILLANKENVNENIFDVYLSKEKEFAFSHKKNQFDFTKMEGFEFKVFSDEISTSLTKKIKINSVILDSIVQIKAGLQAYEKDKGIPKQTAEDVKDRPYDYKHKFDNSTFKYLEGKDVGRYFVSWSGLYLKYGEHLAAPRTFNLFNGKKIIIREITGKYPKSIICTYNEDVYLYNRSNIAIIEKDDKNISLKYILPILNSTLISYYFMKNTAKSVRKMFPKVILNDLRLFPFKEINMEYQLPFIQKADSMLELNQQLQEKSTKFLNRVKDNLTNKGVINIGVNPNVDTKSSILSKKLESFYDYDFRSFISELQKQKIKLSLVQQDEWEEYFNTYKTEINQLQAEIEKTDKEIDQMVYELYELAEDEIAIVENSIKQ